MARLGLVLSGGGARAAYEAGVIHYLRTGLPKKIASRNFEIHCGSSAGTINTAAMVAMADDPLYQGKRIQELWLNLRQENIYRRDFTAAASFLFNSIRGVFRNLTASSLFHLGQGGPHLNAFLDTTPLVRYVKENIPWERLIKNIQKGIVSAISVTATNTRSGRVELFIFKTGEVKYTGEYRYYEGIIQPKHVMASASIPVIFPTVKIGKVYYTDGGLRLFSPVEKLLTRLLDVNTDEAIELMSYLVFAKDYLKELINLGYENAKRGRNRLIEIME